jgi:hypothetical protein
VRLAALREESKSAAHHDRVEQQVELVDEGALEQPPQQLAAAMDLELARGRRLELARPFRRPRGGSAPSRGSRSGNRRGHRSRAAGSRCVMGCQSSSPKLITSVRSPTATVTSTIQ